MKTSISVVFNLVQIYISNSSKHEQNLDLNDQEYDEYNFSNSQKDNNIKRTLSSSFKTIIVKYIPFLVTVLK